MFYYTVVRLRREYPIVAPYTLEHTTRLLNIGEWRHAAVALRRIVISEYTTHTVALWENWLYNISGIFL